MEDLIWEMRAGETFNPKWYPLNGLYVRMILNWAYVYNEKYEKLLKGNERERENGRRMM